MLWLEGDQLNVSFSEAHKEASCRIEFQRTLRIPDDGRTYPLPAGLGRFPLRHIEDFADRLPSELIRRGGLVMPMWQAEALWIKFDSDYPFAVKVATGKINAVTGGSWKVELQQEPQDYLVLPRQPWLDGYCVEKGKIRQFVAAPLRSGHSVQEQVTGRAEWGGFQLLFCPMKAERFQQRKGHRELRRCYSLPANKMGIAAGGLMRQELYEDQEGIDAWDQGHVARCFITILNAQQWSELTGERPPTQPITAAKYLESGIPWFDWYAKDQKALEGSTFLSTVKPFPTKSDGLVEGEEPMKVTAKHVGPHCRPVTEFSDTVLEAELNRIEARLEEALRTIEKLKEDLALLSKKLLPPLPKPRAKPRFFVEFNGEMFERETAAETMADFLDAVGLERVARLGLRIAKLPLVSHNEPPRDRGCIRRRGWVIVTHASNADKKAILEQVVDELGLQARIRIMQPIELSVDRTEAQE